MKMIERIAFHLWQFTFATAIGVSRTAGVGRTAGVAALAAVGITAGWVQFTAGGWGLALLVAAYALERIRDHHLKR